MERSRNVNEEIIELSLKIMPLYGVNLSDDDHEKYTNEVNEFQIKMGKKYNGKNGKSKNT
jgi:hypothetical protein